MDYWTLQGYLVPEGASNPGSGQQRRWSTEEVAVARNLVFLVHCGLTVQIAAEAARGAVLSAGAWQYAHNGVLAFVWRDEAIDKTMEQREIE